MPVTSANPKPIPVPAEWPAGTPACRRPEARMQPASKMGADRHVSRLAKVAREADHFVLHGATQLGRIQTPDASAFAQWWAVVGLWSSDAKLEAALAGNRGALLALDADLARIQRVIGAEPTWMGLRAPKMHPALAPAAPLLADARDAVQDLAERGSRVKPAQKAALRDALARLHMIFANI